MIKRVYGHSAPLPVTCRSIPLKRKFVRTRETKVSTLRAAIIKPLAPDSEPQRTFPTRPRKRTNQLNEFIWPLVLYNMQS